MKHKLATIALITATLATIPLASANAQGWHRWHGGGWYGGWPFFGAIAGVTGAAIALSAIPPPIAYAPPPPVYYGPPAPPVYYGYRPVYMPPRVVYYGAPYYPPYYPY
jgi:hypothetical protein